MWREGEERMKKVEGVDFRSGKSKSGRQRSDWEGNRPCSKEASWQPGMQNFWEGKT